MTKSRAIILVSLMGTHACLLICEMFGCSHATVAEVVLAKETECLEMSKRFLSGSLQNMFTELLLY